MKVALNHTMHGSLMSPLIVACYQSTWSGSGKVFRLDLGKTVEGCFRIPAQVKRFRYDVFGCYFVVLPPSVDFGGPVGHQMPGGFQDLNRSQGIWMDR